jgi:hypothetical protein
MSIGLAFALVLATAARSAQAQTVHGAVRDSLSHTPIPGAVVMLLDSSGAVLSRGITDQRGEYRVADSGRAQSLRVVRIGFQPRVTNVPGSPDRAAPLDVGMIPFVTRLTTIQVKDKSLCPRRSDAAAAEGLWEQARAGLLATVVAREANPATLHRLGFQRTLDGNSDRITRFLVAGDSVSGAAKSFSASASATGFVKSGFEKDSAGKQIVFGPDADVLLDDAFADGYCFHVAEPSRARPNEVGLAFGAAEHHQGRVDIEGTLWIDTVARALRDIEFRYIGLPVRTIVFRPGGEVSFRQMGNGVVFIDRWQLRSVTDGPDTVYDASMRNGNDFGTRPRMYAVESGGEVASAAWPDGHAWHDSLGAVQLHAVTSRGQPATGAVVALTGTPYRGTADASGNVVIADLLPGPYSAVVLDSRLASAGVSTPTPIKFVATRDSTLRITMTVPTADEFARSRCLAAAKRYAIGDSVFILGRVATSSGIPIADAKVLSAVRLKSGDWRWIPGAYTTGSDGVFQICSRDLERNGSVKIRVEVAGRRAPVQVVETTRTLSTNLTVVPVVVNRPLASASATATRAAPSGAAAGAARAGGQGAIAGVVYDSLTTHAPVAGATVVLLELSRYATTDEHGRFRIDSVPTGAYTLGVTFASLDALDVALPPFPVDVRAGEPTAVTVASPSAESMYMGMCRAARDRDTGIIIGRVRDVDDRAPLADATIRTDWMEFTVATGGAAAGAAGRAAGDHVHADARTDAGGAYVLCGVPAGVALDLTSELAGFGAGPTSLTMDSTSLIRRVDFAISRRDSAARVVRMVPADSASPQSSGRGTASLQGVVLNTEGRPLRDAVVAIVGSPDSVRTDAAGAFHLEGIPAGTRSVEVRSIGLSPTRVSMDFTTSGVRDTTLSMSRSVQALAAVTVAGRGNAMSLAERSGFETRREHGLGAFVTQDDIAKHNYGDFISILRTMPGLHIEYIRRAGGMPPLPMPYLVGSGSLAPFPVVSPADYDDLSGFLRPGLIRGIEVYANPGTIPAQYDLTSSTGCGSIVIWTR